MKYLVKATKDWFKKYMENQILKYITASLQKWLLFKPQLKTNFEMNLKIVTALKPNFFGKNVDENYDKIS